MAVICLMAPGREAEGLPKRPSRPFASRNVCCFTVVYFQRSWVTLVKISETTEGSPGLVRIQCEPFLSGDAVVVCFTGPLCRLAEVEGQLESVLLFRQGIRVVCGPLPQLLRSSLSALTLGSLRSCRRRWGDKALEGGHWQAPGGPWGPVPPPRRPRVQGFTGAAAAGGTGPVSGAAVGWGAGGAWWPGRGQSAAWCPRGKGLPGRPLLSGRQAALLLSFRGGSPRHEGREGGSRKGPHS